MKKVDDGWPDVEAPAPMTVDELEAILFALGNAYGQPYEQFPAKLLARALGLTTPRMVQRWRDGGTIPPTAAKLLRIFHSQSKVF